MKIPIYQIDAFTDKQFSGNPAAVCPLKSWPESELLQAIAAENNLSETAFFVEKQEHFELRWFTPVIEVNLCGHATLASSYVIFNELDTKKRQIQFKTKSGILPVKKETEFLVMNFPTFTAEACPVTESLVSGLGKKPLEAYRSASMDYLVVFESEKDIRNLQPDFEILKSLDLPGMIVTAKGTNVDFVSRVFAPKEGINEDPVTGAAHSTLAPFWAQRLGKNTLHAYQLSKRGGNLYCEIEGDRVLIRGQAVKYMDGMIYLNH